LAAQLVVEVGTKLVVLINFEITMTRNA